MIAAGTYAATATLFSTMFAPCAIFTGCAIRRTGTLPSRFDVDGRHIVQAFRLVII